MIGNNHLFKQAPENLAHAVNSISIIKFARRIKLRQQIFGPLDGSCHQLGEKAYIGHEIYKIGRRFEFPVIHINRITHRLESIEADSNRQDDGQPACFKTVSQQPEAVSKCIQKEIIVLEKSQKSQICRNTDRQQQLPF